MEADLSPCRRTPPRRMQPHAPKIEKKRSKDKKVKKAAREATLGLAGGHRPGERLSRATVLPDLPPLKNPKALCGGYCAREHFKKGGPQRKFILEGRRLLAEGG